MEGHMILTKILISKYMNEFWKSNATISIDQRNDRNIITISKSKVQNLCKDIQDRNITSVKLNL